MKITRGDIILADTGVDETMNNSIQRGIRPYCVISNNKANSNSPVSPVIPLTTKTKKKRYLPTHVFLNAYKADGLTRNALVVPSLSTIHPKEEFAKAMVAMLVDAGLLVFVIKNNELVAYKSSIDKELMYEKFTR